MTLQETRERLKAYFSNDSASDPRKWSELWDNGDFLPWDRGLSNPALEDLLIERKDLLGPGFVESANGAKKPKKALVPGCGRGYDVLLLASFGYDTVDLEVSQAAVKKCYEMMEAQLDKYPPRQGTVSGEVNFLVGDFFGDEWIRKSGLADEGGKFDLIYDYTFFCALPPSTRPQWALRMSQILAAGGNLICLEFPSSKDPKIGGPPYGFVAMWQ